MKSLKWVALEAEIENRQARTQAQTATAKAAFEREFGILDAEYSVSSCFGLGQYVKIKSGGLTLAYDDGWFRLGRRILLWIDWSVGFKDALGLGRQLRKFERMYFPCGDFP